MAEKDDNWKRVHPDAANVLFIASSHLRNVRPWQLTHILAGSHRLNVRPVACGKN